MSVNTSSIFYSLGSKVKTELDKKLDLAGGTLTGALTLSGAPTSDLHAATKAYVDTASDTSSLQTELDDTQTGAGLGTDGSYSADSSADYISGATSLANADSLLDDQIKSNADNINTNAGAINTVEESVGLSTAGAFSISGDYFGAANNLVSAVESLDDQVATNAENISNNDGDITALETATSSLASDGNSASFSGNISAADAVFSGNLTVNGTTTTIDTTNIDVKDSIMNISKGASGGANASNDGGFIVERGSSENNVAFIWDEGSDKFTCLSTSATASATDISSTDSSASLAVLDADLYQNGTSVGSVDDFETALTGGTSGSGS